MVTGTRERTRDGAPHSGRARKFSPGALFRRPGTWIVLALTTLSFLQMPGKTTFDTKLDLAVDPLAFLGRALHLWNPQATAGELQNQAYGYLFPMGPFFALCQAAGLPAWIAQRLWGAILLSAAFGGALLLARAMRVGTERTRLIGALGYALAPRMLTEIGGLSAEMLPAVLLPWVLVPLVRAGKIGSPRRAAGLSAVAVLCMGGVNGAMVVMALVLPGLWLLTRRWTRRHAELVLWWFVFVAGATLWWILPLLLLGEYSLPFLDYIESATNTTAPMSLFEVLRGTNQWVAYVVQGTPWWPGGWSLIDNPVLMLATGLVAAVGLLGLTRRGLPERRFLVLGVLTGLTLLTIGYVGTLDSPVAEQVRHLLDGPLAPLRNVHKFEPVLRLPLMLAFVHGVAGPVPSPRRFLRPALGLLLVVVMAAPAWLLDLRSGPGWDEVPGYWYDAMGYVAKAGPQARTLLLPATGFGEYEWGRTVDEPAQAIAKSPWAVRNQVPLGSEGNTRLMDSVDAALADGRGDPGLAALLARSGYRFLLLRDDIDRSRSTAPPAETLRAGLAGSPGIGKAARFGPLEVYEVKQPVPLATATSTKDVPTVSGGPENLLPLIGSGQLDPATPVVLAGDGGSPGGPRLVTDGLRRAERNVGGVRDNLSQTLTAGEAFRQQRAAGDVLPFPGQEHQTVAAYRGIRAVTASTAASYADAFGGSDPGHQPFAAIDGDPRTFWRSSSFTGPIGQWLEVELDTPRLVTSVDLELVDDIRVGWPATRIRITTDNGSIDQQVVRGAGAHSYAVAPGVTRKVRITLLSLVVGRQDGNVGIAELKIPGTEPQRALEVPADLPAGPAPGFAFTRGTQPRYACLPVGGAVRCDASAARDGEEPDGVHRLFSTSAEQTFLVGGTVLPAGGGTNPVSLPGVTVTATSQLGGDPAAGGFAAVDGDAGTTWRPDVTDLRPALTLDWAAPKRISGLHIGVSPASGARPPRQLELVGRSGTRSVRLDAGGSASFEPLDTDRLRIVLPGDDDDPAARAVAGIGSLELSGTDGLLPGPDPAFTVPCGAGPNVHLDGFDYRTSVQGTLADITAHRPLPLRMCRDSEGGISLPAGGHELRTDRSASFVVQDLWLRPAGAAAPPVHRAVQAGTWDAASRRVTVAPGPEAVLAVPENANAGWVATMDGRELARTRVDGWQQAWIVPAGAGGVVSLVFTPDTAYRTSLLVGAFAVLLMLAGVCWPARRRTYPVAAGGALVPVALIGLLVALGGMLPVVLLIACLLARQFRDQAPRYLAFGGMVVAAVVSVTGRVLGHGQDWAYGPVTQAALLLSAAATVATCVDWFAVSEKPG
ncbi:alpha-(1-_3)-arabinofuranosyltransferase [Amycolatopsis australiensis]|uniref:Arabinofuranan 3-O-arabinosyltransferase n=1 Tax=Amycolatopsis australiensis TaxID=546364 RepID=A0A1K1RBW9_9PSEU|nr:alpha-(1->3)-arabinofuranosyltransferase [Amycolatopsis australiensis]SFW69746.1 arabinofuranan 3-O-arabinosyltransferase [Amycolatopsis australiensis]